MVSDEDLMVAFRGGAESAFDVLFERYREPIWRFFRRRLTDPARAEELAQDMFVALVQNAGRYVPRAPFRRYLFGIAFNIWLAARRQTRPAAVMPEGWEPPAATADPAAAIWVRQALASLPDLDRDVLMLREYDQLDYAEIAALTGVPIGTVRSRLFRARMALRAELTGQTGDEAIAAVPQERRTR
jgi:RNA polymerase sigma-70 factor (ECF subfamily)